MNNMLTKGLWLVCGILFVFAGIVAIFNPADTLASISYILGLATLISGVIEIAIYSQTYNLKCGAGWILMDGVLGAVLGILMLSGGEIVAGALPFIFAMWLMINGISKAITAFDIKRLGITGWGWMVLVGTLCTILGFASIFHPAIAIVSISMVVGILLIVQGAVALFLWAFSAKLR